MFYCEECADRNSWPKAYWLPLSRGKCEWCGYTEVCFDVPSRALPPAKEPRPAQPTAKTDTNNV